ncbi:MAG: hypothetical protein IJ640_00385, partial [Prevotella sp.]|nr:hypothetical protein [Prevotella sp.]
QNKRYVFKIAGKEFEADDDCLSTVRRASHVLTKCSVELNAKRGYLVKEIVDRFFYQDRDVFGWTTRSEEMTMGLVFIQKPCKEYAALQRYLEKHAKMKLNDLDLYDVNVFGKRASNYTESGERRYYAHDSKRCKEILDWLGKNRKQGDTVKVDVKDKRYCEDENYSREYETESYGTQYRYLFIRIIRADGVLRAKLETW